MSAKTGTLTIQKFVSLLNEFHYEEFRKHLAENNAALPLKLVETIRKKLPEFQTHADLCCAVYGSCGKREKLNFNQLTAHTFKLSSYLSQNYPSYLHHNIPLVEQLINSGKREEGLSLANNLLDVAELIEDFQTQISVLKFLTQQAFLLKDISNGFKLNARLEKACQSESKFHEIISSLRKTLYQHGVGHKPENLKELINFYKKFHNDSAASVRILSKHARVNTIYYYNPAMFDSTEDIAVIKSLEKDLQNNSCVVFPFLFDIKGVLGFLMLNSSLIKRDSKQGEKFLQELQKHYDSVLFWKYYLNMPQMFLIAARSSHFLTNYHYHIHRPDYHEILKPGDRDTMLALISKTEDFLKNQNLGQFYKNDVISLRMLYGGLLIFSGGKNVEKGVTELESMLLAYQQINLSGSTDSIFLCLMIGYFSTKNHEKCDETFRRYQKIIKNKPVYESNDISIHTYYYLSRWLSTGSKQYLNKLLTNYKRTRKNEGPRRAMDELLSYFKVPVKLKV